MGVFNISSDGITVWVNGPENCLGRFGRFGIDIHTTMDAMDATGIQCLFCTHEPTTVGDWELFRTKMRELHNVEIPSKYCPDRFQAPLPAPSVELEPQA